ncbi:hypothetical protein F1559_002561 [Cyanidiococcus yangmingshanensis]|uniref:Uncharacterized protein n=1 Tax=Cyanidiococcus yangmingshanensis TaxID=2690220 RepID=A0A7J7IMW7_9RHOD|nr:hypothetical protein F1559_002561 [Cyanidiococcus yangmingshanensis]
MVVSLLSSATSLHHTVLKQGFESPQEADVRKPLALIKERFFWVIVTAIGRPTMNPIRERWRMLATAAAHINGPIRSYSFRGVGCSTSRFSCRTILAGAASRDDDSCILLCESIQSSAWFCPGERPGGAESDPAPWLSTLNQ